MVVQIIGIAVFFAYAMMWYLFSGVVSGVAKEIRSGPDSQFCDSGNRNYVSFNFWAHATGVFAVSVFACRILFAHASGMLGAAMPPWSIPLLGVAVTAAIETIMLLQRSALHVAGYVTVSASFIQSLLHLRKIHFAMFAVIAVPVMLLYNSYGGAWNAVFLYAGAILILGMACVYLCKSYVLFVGQKISILYWFLYLCIVELFPVSLVISILLRII